MCKASKLGWVLKIIHHKSGFWSYASPNAVSAEAPPPVVHKKRNMRVWCSGSIARLNEQEESSTPLMRKINGCLWHLKFHNVSFMSAFLS